MGEVKLVAGLGNPGRKYEGTRHNVGFRVVDELARRWQVQVKRQQFAGLAEMVNHAGQRVLLLKPATFMNKSGESLTQAMRYYSLAGGDVMVVHDDMALPLGRIRVRSQGGAGGHNGVSDIIARLGDDGFARLRLGIEQVSGERMVDHVLSPFSAAEEAIIAPAVMRAADAVECWLTDGMDTVMNRYNRAEERPPDTQRA